MTIHRIENYRNEEGLLVEVHHEIVEGQFLPLPSQITYWAKVHTAPLAELGGESLPIDVPLDCKDIHEAFQVFKDQVKAKGQGVVRGILRRMQAEALQQRIAQGGRAPLPPALNG